MQDELKAIQRSVGTTFVHVTHDQEEAMAIADNIIVMNQGRVEDVGKPEAIYLRPKSLFTAGFMGDTNQVAGKVGSIEAGVISVDCASGVVLLSSENDINNNIRRGDEVVLCIRPEHISTTVADSANQLNIGLVKLTERSFFGAYQRCRVTTSDGTSYIAHLPQSTELQINDELPLSVKTTHVVLLKADHLASFIPKVD